MKKEPIETYLRRINFTLVELLVVIAIIAILAGMLLPALNNARKRVQAVNCISKLKQIGFCAEFYAQDNDDFAPPCVLDLPGATYSWEKSLSGYLPKSGTNYSSGDESLFHCPGDPEYVQMYGLISSYGANKNLYLYKPSASAQWRKYRSIQKPSVFIQAMDTYRSAFFSPGDTNPWYYGFGSVEEPLNQKLIVRHNKQLNVLHGDGHASNISTPVRACKLDPFVWSPKGLKTE